MAARITATRNHLKDPLPTWTATPIPPYPRTPLKTVTRMVVTHDPAHPDFNEPRAHVCSGRVKPLDGRAPAGRVPRHAVQGSPRQVVGEGVPRPWGRGGVHPRLRLQQRAAVPREGRRGHQ